MKLTKDIEDKEEEMRLWHDWQTSSKWYFTYNNYITITLHYNYITLHYITLQLHYITLQLHYNYITLQLH